MVKKTVLITGANRGIGKQLALCYAHQPESHLILIARKAQQLAEVALSCEQLGASVVTATIDVRNAHELKNFILEQDSIQPVDLVIANAGVSTTLQPGWQPETEEDINQVFAANLHGALNTITPLIDRMISRKSGQIALMGSLAGMRGLPQSPGYCASKAALHVYGQSLRAWLARYNVKVNVIYPGYIKTDMSDHLVGPKPFLISSKKAAQLILKGLARNKAIIAFPWQIHLLMKLAIFLPTGLVDGVLNQFESYVRETP